MKGMHGVCLHPGRAILELKVRLFNRTPFMQTFLWWANAAIRVHEKYQSFFPPDVRYVADHAKRAITSFPRSNSPYYGVDYEGRAKTGVPEDEKPRMFVPDGSYPPNDLSWYANIPVPTSYMVVGSEGDFLGGYDHKAQAGVVHVANHHIAPGKKQWTWGNHEFGYAWDRSLTDHDGPYIELMAGVYTDNQPDFSYLAPWETRTFSQYWYPIHQIGVPQSAQVDAALSLTALDGLARIGVQVTRPITAATILLKAADVEIARWEKDLCVAEPLVLSASLPPTASVDNLAVYVAEGNNKLIEYVPARVAPAKAPTVAQEPAAPENIATSEELYLTGLHLEQYRHATRQPNPYWEEALRRDPGDSRAHNALGLWRLRRGEFDRAAGHFESAIARLTRLNPNPRDSEPFYNLGLVRRYQGRVKEAQDHFYKATWNAAWRAPAHFALAECAAATGDWYEALDHVQRSLGSEADNLNARNLLGAALKKLGENQRAQQVFAATLSMDPLDVGARWQKGIPPRDGQECLDLALDLLRSGQEEESLLVLQSAGLNRNDGSAPMILYTIAHAHAKLLHNEAAQEARHRAAGIPLDYCFPSRLEEMVILQEAVTAEPANWAAHYLLGNLLYDKQRFEEAIACWETAATLYPAVAVLHRNLGIAYFNIRNNPAQALQSFELAFELNPSDARVFYERDQLWKRVGKSPERRLSELLRHTHLVQLRDDLSVELATVFNQLGQPQDALDVLLQRKFQPWEGGEGLVLAQYVRSQLLLGHEALETGDAAVALHRFESALRVPENLSEAKHLLANQSDIYYWLGEANAHLGRNNEAAAWWQRAAREKGDFQQMSVLDVSDMMFWSGLALQRLEKKQEAVAIFQRIYDHSVGLESAEPKIDYFATSLPAMLLFEDDLFRRKRIYALFLRAQAVAGLGRSSECGDLLTQVLQMDCSHAGAADLLRQMQKPPEKTMVP
jgi:tetratricopeptide (TPR) repeat protein